jgi:hypothetical protein
MHNTSEIHSMKLQKSPYKGEMMHTKSMSKRVFTGVISLVVFAGISISSAVSANAADCNTGSTCTVPKQSESDVRTGSEMSTVSGAGPSNNAGQSGAIKNQYSAINSSKTKRVWTKTATINCSKGGITLHLSEKKAVCPTGYSKKK